MSSTKLKVFSYLKKEVDFLRALTFPYFRVILNLLFHKPKSARLLAGSFGMDSAFIIHNHIVLVNNMVFPLFLNDIIYIFAF